MQTCCKGDNSLRPGEDIDIEFTITKNVIAEACEAIRRDSELLAEKKPLDTAYTSTDTKLCYVSLTVTSANKLPVGTVYELSPLGYELSPREFKDRTTYFGSCKRERLADGRKGAVENDVVLPLEVKTPGRHFMISYDWDSNVYYIEDLGVGLGVRMVINLQPTFHIDPGTTFSQRSLKS